MLEIAMNTKKVQNLEASKKVIKDTIVKTSFEHFTDHKFIAIASKICVGIDDSQILFLGQVDEQLKINNATQMSAGHEDEILLNKTTNINEVGKLKTIKITGTSPVGMPSEHSEGVFCCNNALDSPRTPTTPEGLKGISAVIDDYSVGWTHISKYGRGKHPRKTMHK